MLVLVLLLIIILILIIWLTPQNRHFLTKQEILSRFIGNSEIGITNHSQSIYELYFPNGQEVILRKRKDDHCEVHNGTWTVDGEGTITSHWPSYSDKYYIIRYLQLGQDTYGVYNVNNACGPAGSVCRNFIRIPGNIFATTVC